MMKKYLVLVLIIAMMAVGCTAKDEAAIDKDTKLDNGDAAEETADKAELGVDEQMDFNPYGLDSNQMDNIVDTLRTLSSLSEPYELVQYVDMNIDKLDEFHADELVLILDESIHSYIDKYTQILFAVEGYQVELAEAFGSDHKFDKTQISNEALLSIIDNMEKGGYQLDMLEGNIYPFPDYGIMEGYLKYTSDEIDEYLMIVKDEYDELTYRDAAIVIDHDILVNRVERSEKFLLTYPESKRYEYVGGFYTMYIGAYIFGSNNTMLYDFETRKMTDEAKTDFESALTSMESEFLIGITNDMMGKLKETEYVYTDDVFEYINDLLTKAVHQYGLRMWFEN